MLVVIDFDVVSYFILRNKEGDREFMELITISEITRAFNVSTRTLPYYEEIGSIISNQLKEAKTVKEDKNK